MIEIYKGYWTRQIVESQPDKIFVFGDNTHDRLYTKHIPTSTQAVIRGLPNAFGIDTKTNRTQGGVLDDKFYFSYIKYLDCEFDKLYKLLDTKIIVFPEDGLGTGKANMEKCAPKCFKYLQYKINEIINHSRNINK